MNCSLKGFATNTLFLAAPAPVLGLYSIFDRVDQVSSIRILAISGLPCKSEILPGNARGQVVTDFLFPRSYSVSWGEDSARATVPTTTFTVGDQARQDIVYTATDPLQRAIQLNLQAPVTNITLEAYYITKDGTANIITLPPQTAAELKILFIKRQD